MTIKDEIKNKIIPNEIVDKIVDEVKDITLYKKVEGLKDELATAKRCIKEKDRRITKIENRWNSLAWTFKWGTLSSIVGLFAVSLVWMMVHIHTLLPLVVYDSLPDIKGEGMIYGDWFLLISTCVIFALAIIGFIALLVVAYIYFHED